MLDALDRIAEEMRSIVTRPTVKGEPSGVLGSEGRGGRCRSVAGPGGVLLGHGILGTWRPRASGKKLRLALNAWSPVPDLTEQAERLAAFRGVTFDGFVDA